MSKGVKYGDSARRKRGNSLNMALTKVMRDALAQVGLPQDCICLVEDTSRAVATQMMQLNGYIDVLIPRGGRGADSLCCGECDRTGD